MPIFDLAKMAADCCEPASSPAPIGQWARQDGSCQFKNSYACAYKRTDRSGLVVLAFCGTELRDFSGGGDVIRDDFAGIGLGYALALHTAAAIEWAAH